MLLKNRATAEPRRGARFSNLTAARRATTPMVFSKYTPVFLRISKYTPVFSRNPKIQGCIFKNTPPVFWDFQKIQGVYFHQSKTKIHPCILNTGGVFLKYRGVFLKFPKNTGGVFSKIQGCIFKIQGCIFKNTGVYFLI